jgi:hypothetical protein
MEDEYVSNFLSKKFKNIVDPNTLEEMKLQIKNKFKVVGENVWRSFSIFGQGVEDVMKFPDTKIHKELFPELYNFNFHHFECEIIRCPNTWCGYVKTNKFHPIWKNKDIEDLFGVHGGITYQNIGSLTIGFDTNHYDDDSPFSMKKLG